MPYVTYASNGYAFKVDDHQFILSATIPPFIFTIDTRNTSIGSSASNQFTLPTLSGGVYGAEVQWGDGETSVITAYNSAYVTHTYSTPGTYNVQIDGVFHGFRFNNSGDKLKILNIFNWGLNFRLCSATSAQGNYFQGCANLTITAADKLDLTSVTSLYSAFNGCTSLATAPTMALWDTSNVVNMNSVFTNCSIFNQPIGAWNTSSVINMGSMFSGCSSFNQPLNSWNTAKVTTFSTMFYNCTVFNQPLSNWNTSLSSAFDNMFSYARAFNQDISGWNVSRGGNFSYMFRNAISFNQPIGAWTTTNMNNTTIMFQGATAFNQDLGNWNMSKVTSTAYMFQGATAFKKNLGAWSPLALTNAINMFYGIDINDTGTTTNYDALLTGWAAKAILSNVQFSGGNSKYSSMGKAAREYLTGAKLWTISDGGLAA